MGKTLRLHVTHLLPTVSLAFLFTACDVTKPLTLRVGEPTAKLRYVATVENDPTVLNRVNVEKCPSSASFEAIADTGPGALLFNSAKEVSTVHMIGSSDQPQALVRERVIPAGKPLFFKAWAFRSAAQYTPGYSCGNAGVFIPLAEREYELTYAIEPTTPTCDISIVELGRDHKGEVIRIAEPTAQYFSPRENSKDYCGLKP